MFWLLRARLHVPPCLGGEIDVPDEVLSAVKSTPVPVGAHGGADEVGVVLMGCGIVLESAAVDVMEWSCHGGGGYESSDEVEEVHLVGLGGEVQTEVPGVCRFVLMELVQRM